MEPQNRKPPAGYISDVIVPQGPPDANPARPATPVSPRPTAAGVRSAAPAFTPLSPIQPTRPAAPLAVQPPPRTVPAAAPTTATPPTSVRPTVEADRWVTDAPQTAGTSKVHQGVRDLLSIAGVLVSALLLAFCLITFVFQSYQVDGPSMQTTLENKDHLIVWKVPKTAAKLTGGHYIPHRGDIIVFNESGTGGTEKQLIKRVMALPGERIVVKNNTVTVYNQQNPNGFSPDKTLPYGSVIKVTPGNGDWTIKENQIFVMGDHRDNSLDSRHFGPVDSDQIIGKLVLRILPLNTATKF